MVALHLAITLTAVEREPRACALLVLMGDQSSDQTAPYGTIR